VNSLHLKIALRLSPESAWAAYAFSTTVAWLAMTCMTAPAEILFDPCFNIDSSQVGQVR
jgi:hypothetical protein